MLRRFFSEMRRDLDESEMEINGRPIHSPIGKLIGGSAMMLFVCFGLFLLAVGVIFAVALIIVTTPLWLALHAWLRYDGRYGIIDTTGAQPRLYPADKAFKPVNRLDP